MTRDRWWDILRPTPRPSEVEVLLARADDALLLEMDRNDILLAENERLREAMDRIKYWSESYPEDIFTPLSDAEEKAAVEAMCAAVSAGSDRMHASWARYLMKGVGDIARAALGTGGNNG